MPLLTDRQEPEDYDREKPDEPNEYAIRYLFTPNRPGVELERTGLVLFYSAVATNLLALALYAAWLEFTFNTGLLVLALLIVAASGTAAYFLSRRPSLAYFLATVPALLTVGSLLYFLVTPTGEQTAYFGFFLPGSLVLAASVFLLGLARKANT
ncbi:MAG: hypothetical protein JWP00_4667 [Chloroflexi bacterium]|jgi:hypothetical protein|nr:hypothetical protein [Chloroflexota bacterium]